MSRKAIYWICQLTGWGLYAFFSVGMTYIFADADIIQVEFIIGQIIVASSLLLFSHLFRLYIKKKNWAANKVRVLIPKVILGVLTVAMITPLFVNVLFRLIPIIDGDPDLTLPNYIGFTFGGFSVMSLWSTIYFAFQFVQRNRKNEIEKLELNSALQEAELAILKNQVNPHFLFNALNNIRSLILSDPEKARKMITHISELLRYSIQFNASEKVPLSQELEIVKDYLQLESVQFNDRLSYDFQIDEDTLQVKIPPMAIQLLVENAIKHGISQLSTGGNIHIAASMQTDHLSIEVTNTGQLQQKGKREGIGLKNLIERLQILFGQFADLKLENSGNQTVTASLKIPLA